MSGIAHFFSQPLVGFILKLLAGIATAVFGIIGLGRDSRKENGDLPTLLLSRASKPLHRSAVSTIYYSLAHNAIVSLIQPDV
jgi:hypothetical protein